ncbi:MAG: amino acid permease, partial [Candidatus Binataceae bacterium]
MASNGLVAQLFRRKRAETMHADAANEFGLHRALTATDLTLLGIGAIVGAGIFVLTGVGAQHAGPGLIASFVLAGLACAMAALCYSE